VFLARDLGLETKRLVYQSIVLDNFLCGAESWAPTQVTVQKLETFHRHCVGSITGIVKAVQWAQNISSIQLAERFGIRKSISNSLGSGGWVMLLGCLTIVYQNRFCLDGYLRQDLPMV